MYNLTKRLIDLIISISTILLLSPFFLIVIIVLKLTGEGEVFYLQERYGFKNKKFKIIKFATMIKNSPNIGTGSLTLRNDPRVLPFGRFLRKSKINELPQVINVILGDMSIVGPRPQMEQDFIKFPLKNRNKIYLSKPGITGVGSIIFRDEEIWISKHVGDKHDFYKNSIAPYKTDLELWYLKNKTIYVDFMLIILTAWVIISNNYKIVYSVFSNLPKKPDNFPDS